MSACIFWWNTRWQKKGTNKYGSYVMNMISLDRNCQLFHTIMHSEDQNVSIFEMRPFFFTLTLRNAKKSLIYLTEVIPKTFFFLLSKYFQNWPIGQPDIYYSLLNHSSLCEPMQAMTHDDNINLSNVGRLGAGKMFLKNKNATWCSVLTKITLQHGLISLRPLINMNVSNTFSMCLRALTPPTITCV